MSNAPSSNAIEKLWTDSWTAGITNPLTFVEQVSLLMFVRLLDVMEARGEDAAKRSGLPFEGVFGGKDDPRRWRNFKEREPTDMLRIVRDEVFPLFRDPNGPSTIFEFLSEARLMITSPRLLASAVAIIDDLPPTGADAMGDFYEYLLAKLSTAGVLGQFRTPRHIVRFMMNLVEPKATDLIVDPACGTAGFLIGALEYLREQAAFQTEGTDGAQMAELGACVLPGTLYGFDVDPTMVRIAWMNLMLHGIASPDVHHQDVLSHGFTQRFPMQASKGFDVVFANPPFSGRFEVDNLDPSLTKIANTRKTELLFVTLVLRMLKDGGRGAMIMPSSFVSAASKAHVALRRTLVQENRLEAVISLPAGVFKPYAGVATTILVFTKGRRTDDVFFCEIEADGFSLDNKRTPVEANDLPTALDAWRTRSVADDRTTEHFTVPASELEANCFNLSIGRYRQIKVDSTSDKSLEELLAELRELEEESSKSMAALRTALEEVLGHGERAPRVASEMPR